MRGFDSTTRVVTRTPPGTLSIEIEWLPNGEEDCEPLGSAATYAPGGSLITYSVSVVAFTVRRRSSLRAESVA